MTAIANEQITYPPLTPLRADWMEQLFETPDTLQALIEQYGSPINIHHTPTLAKNYEEYADVFEQHQLNFQVFFARKANKCKAFVTQARDGGFGVDTASYQELKQCLELGVPAERLVFTAAIKEERAIRLAVESEVLIILDNTDECALTERIAKELNKEAIVGCRISGFWMSNVKLYSRFGFDVDDFVTFMKKDFHSYNKLNFKGLHFHLDGYSIEQRGQAMHQSFAIAEQLKVSGYRVEFLDIGGGLLMNYLESGEQWEAFQATLKAAVRGEHPPITYRNDGLGYEMIDGKLQGKLKTYPYYNESARATFLDQVLQVEQKERSVAERARQLNIEIRLEPGRSLLDRTGMTVAKVIHRKQDSRGDWHIGLGMNMTQMYSSSADFLLDPTVIFQEEKEEASPVGVYFTGAYCLERDVLLKRKITIEQLPEKGDLVCFVNTAGYMMHFFESEAHLFDLANNLIWQKHGEEVKAGQFRLD